MIKRILASGGLGIGLMLGGLDLQAAGLQQTVESDADWTHPMTPWGEPDLQGMWPLNHLIGVPLQRQAQFGERRFLTDEEFAARQQSVEARDTRFGAGAIPVADPAGRAMRMTSLIVDPPDGRFPELTETGVALQAGMRGSYNPGQTVFDGIGDFSAWDRCITRGMPTSMLPRNYNNGIRIVQSPGYVVIILEMAHEARIIPTDPRPPLDSPIRQWLGESRGRWEGQTLVVETTNYNGRVGLTSAGVPGSPGPLQPSTVNMRTIERFTRVDDETIEYEMTVEDPTVLATGSFTVAYPMIRDNSYEMYEYACHEGNTAVRYYIETSRYERAAQPGQ